MRHIGDVGSRLPLRVSLRSRRAPAAWPAAGLGTYVSLLFFFIYFSYRIPRYFTKR